MLGVNILATGYRASVGVVQAGAILSGFTAFAATGRVAQAGLFGVAKTTAELIPGFSTATKFVARHMPQNAFVTRIACAAYDVIIPKNIHVVNSLKVAGVALATSYALHALADSLLYFEDPSPADSQYREGRRTALSTRSVSRQNNGRIPRSYHLFATIFGFGILNQSVDTRAYTMIRAPFELFPQTAADLITDSYLFSCAACRRALRRIRK